MPAGKYDITFEEGADFDHTWTWWIPDPTDFTEKPRKIKKDLSGWTGRAQVRRTVDAADPPLLDLTVGNGGVVINGPVGAVQLKVSAAQLSALPADFAKGVWAIELTDPTAKVTRFLEGRVIVSAEVVR